MCGSDLASQKVWRTDFSLCTCRFCIRILGHQYCTDTIFWVCMWHAVQFSAVPGDFFWGLVQPPYIGVRKIEQKFAVPTHCGTAPRAEVVKNCGGITSGSSSGGAEGSRKSRRSRAPPSPGRARPWPAPMAWRGWARCPWLRALISDGAWPWSPLSVHTV